MAGMTLPRNQLSADVLAAWEAVVAELGLPKSVRFCIVERRLEAHSPGGLKAPPLMRFYWTGRRWEQYV